MHKNNNIKSIGIVRFSAFGDIIWTLPLVHQILDTFPQAEVTYITDPIFSDILEGIERLNIEKFKKPKKLKDYLNLRREFKEFDFDILICAQASLRINPLYSFIKATRKIGFDTRRGRDGHSFFINESIEYLEEHSVNPFLSMGRKAGVESSSIRFDMNIPKEFTSESKLLEGESYLVVHPKASSVERTWSARNYALLIKKIKDQLNLKVVLTGISADKNFIDEISSQLGTPIINLAGKTSIKELAKVFKEASLVVAPDSGPIHLASAVGSLCVGLYAAVPPAYTGPYGQIENCVNSYPNAVKRFLNKNPESVKWMTRVHHKDLMQTITVDEVFMKIKSLLP